MPERERIQRALFVLVLVGAGIAQVASAAHLAEAFAYANDGAMPIFLAGTVVVLEVTFVALAVITPHGRSRSAVLLGIALVQSVAFAGNTAEAGLRVRARMPREVAAFFGLSPDVTERVAAFLLGGMVPILVLISIYAITTTAEKMLAADIVDPAAVALLDELEAEMQDRNEDAA